MMRKLRQIKKMRGPMIVLVVVLSIGLVGSFTLMGGLGGSPQQPQVGVDPTLSKEEQIAFLEEKMVEFTAELDDTENKMETLGTLAEIQWYLANLYESEEDIDKAMNNSLGYYLQMQELEPENLSVVTQVAVSAYMAGQEELAQENFDKALAMDGTDVNLLANYGVFLMNTRGDFHGAIEQFELALEQDITDEARSQLETFVNFAKQMVDAIENPEANDQNSQTE